MTSSRSNSLDVWHRLWNRVRTNPVALPYMTDAEVFFGPKEKLDMDRYWFRAFKAEPGKPYQNYLHLYVMSPIKTKADLVKQIQSCVPKSYRVKKLPTPGRAGGQKHMLLCCPKEHWNESRSDCSVDRPGGGRAPMMFKVLIPQDDISRLIDEGLIRPAQKPISGLSVEETILGKKHSRPASAPKAIKVRSNKVSHYTLWLNERLTKPLLRDGEIVSAPTREKAEAAVKRVYDQFKLVLYIKEESKRISA